MNVVLMYFVSLFLSSAFFLVAENNIYIHEICFKQNIFTSSAGGMPCVVAQYPQMPGV